MLKLYKLRDYNFKLVIYVTALTILGILVIGSAQRSVQQRQLLGLALGLIFMVVLSLTDYYWLLNFYWIFYIVGLGLLLVVMVAGSSAGGATRWLDLGFLRFQPSDLVKIIMILFYAKFFSKREEQINNPKTIFMALLILAFPLGFLLKQPDLSTSILFMLVFCALIFAAGLSYKIIGGIIAICVPILVIGITYIIRSGEDGPLQGYQMGRILAWLYPERYPDLSYQQTNSIIAIGSGQLYGKGLDTNTVASVNNGNFISQPQTDFIFAVAGEELGFLGCCIIVILELLIAIECIKMAKKARDTAGSLICSGMGALIFLQSTMNICVATGLLPNTGLPLPFVSYGLTSLVSMFMGIGVVLNVGLQVKKY